MNDFFFAFIPFDVPKTSSRHYSKRYHVPQLLFVRHCKVCGTEFETSKRNRIYCSRKCNHFFQNHFSKASLILKKITQDATEEFLRKERGDPSLVHHSFVHGKRVLGTRAPSTNLKIVEVNGQERVYGMVWLEKRMRN